MTHPEKKKHSPRPRPVPPPRLTYEQQLARAVAERSKALLHLGEAQDALRAEVAPNGIAHSAYYAMHHCAIAVLLVNGGVDRSGDVPGSHQLVIDKFSELARDIEGLSECAVSLRQVQSDRIVADYELARSVSMAEAGSAVEQAKTFVKECEARWPELKQ